MPQGMRLTSSVTVINLFNAVHTIVLAQTIPYQAFEPVERIDDQRLVFVLFFDQRVDGIDDIVIRGDKRETGTIDLVETIFGLDKDGLWGLRCGGGLTDAFGALKNDARG